MAHAYTTKRKCNHYHCVCSTSNNALRTQFAGWYLGFTNHMHAFEKQSRMAHAYTTTRKCAHFDGVCNNSMLACGLHTIWHGLHLLGMKHKQI